MQVETSKRFGIIIWNNDLKIDGKNRWVLLLTFDFMSR